jgi:hypothetical protein
MLSLGPCANLLLFARRGVTVEVGVWSPRDLAVRLPSGGSCGQIYVYSVAIRLALSLKLW